MYTRAFSVRRFHVGIVLAATTTAAATINNRNINTYRIRSVITILSRVFGPPNRFRLLLVAKQNMNSPIFRWSVSNQIENLQRGAHRMRARVRVF